mgnify:CR=1 FL=1
MTRFPQVTAALRRKSLGQYALLTLCCFVSVLLITAYAVRGLDINSSYTIYDALNAQKQKGVGVLFIGEDLDVMLELCDRIMVLCHGRVTGVVDARTATKEQLGLMMTGAGEGENRHD